MKIGHIHHPELSGRAVDQTGWWLHWKAAEGSRGRNTCVGLWDGRSPREKHVPMTTPEEGPLRRGQDTPGTTKDLSSYVGLPVKLKYCITLKHELHFLELHHRPQAGEGLRDAPASEHPSGRSPLSITAICWTTLPLI